MILVLCHSEPRYDELNKFRNTFLIIYFVI